MAALRRNWDNEAFLTQAKICLATGTPLGITYPYSVEGNGLMSPTIMNLLAPAKVNLFLDILRKREDGFHDIHTLFHRISLADRITVEVVDAPRPAGHPVAKLTVTAEQGLDGSTIPTNDLNIVVKALQRLEEATDLRLPTMAISIHKAIPHGAGLGGGSSDAAQVLKVANELLGHPLVEAELAEVAATVGSDCPFFLEHSGAAFGTGRGELLFPEPSRRDPILLLIPKFAINTAKAYGALRQEHLGSHTSIPAVENWLRHNGTLPAFHNSFERALHHDFPALAEIRMELLDTGANAARLTGSGSATFGLFPDKETRDKAARSLGKRYHVLAAELCD